MSESLHQIALFSWAALQSATRPELRLLYAIPNGAKRAISTARRLKAEGVRPGVPDVCLPVPRAGYGALYVELKRPHQPGKPKGRISPEQSAWAKSLREAGNAVSIAYGWEEARMHIEGYLAAGAA